MSKDTAQTLSPEASLILACIRDRFHQSKWDESHTITCIFTGEKSYEIAPEHDGNDGYYISINGHVADDDPSVNHVPGLEAAKAEVARRMAQKVSEAKEVLAIFQTVTQEAATPKAEKSAALQPEW